MVRTNMARQLRRVAATGAAVAALCGLGMAGAGQAAAATHKNGVVEVGELGLYYLSNYGTPIFDLYVSDADFSNDYFPGTGIRADNNTESDWNRDTYTWWVCTGYNYGGSCGYIPPGAYGNLNSTYKNTVSSAYFS
ncbi:hypothetical protein [Streptomyces sp. enrichment culture]|uniref:hypothetical protein n=1 Tax=Streptomyces sp. enrichment culture TaxID=1795815 RepID=UPI003F57D35C